MDILFKAMPNLHRLPLKIFVLLHFIILILLFSPKEANAQLFSDNFNDGDAAGWDVIGSPGWNVQGGQYGIYLNPGLSNTLPSNSSWNNSWKNIVFEVDLRGVSGTDKNILVKFKDTNNFVEIHHTGGNIFLEKASTSGGGGILDSVFFPLSNGASYHFRIEIKNDNIKVFIDNNLMLEANDSMPMFDIWKIGLRAGTGAVSPTEVWFDNVVVTELPGNATSTPTPTASPTPSPTPSPAPTPTVTPTPTSEPPIANFELPVSYLGRLLNNSFQFKSAFWNKMRSVFDHVYQTGTFRPFTGNSYTACTDPISCYDSHNGVDFSGAGNQDVYSVANGWVVYTSPHSSPCTPTGGGFGCVALIKYGSHFALFAHLDKIFVNTGDRVTNATLVGEMGATGCPGCLEHLHFGVLKPTANFFPPLQLNRMTTLDWHGLILSIRPFALPIYPPACTYRAPNGIRFSFLDPSGWRGTDKDPWSLPRSKGGCGINSPYLWKYDIGVSP